MAEHIEEILGDILAKASGNEIESCLSFLSLLGCTDYEDMEQLPSPEQLKGKVLIKASALVKTQTNEEEEEEEEEEEDLMSPKLDSPKKEASSGPKLKRTPSKSLKDPPVLKKRMSRVEKKEAKKEEKVSQKLCSLVFFAATKLHTFKDCESWKPNQMTSMSENRVNKVRKTRKICSHH